MPTSSHRKVSRKRVRIDRDKVASKLHAHMNQSGLTNEGLSEETSNADSGPEPKGIDARTISDLRNKKRKQVEWNTVMLLAKVLDLPTGELLEPVPMKAAGAASIPSTRGEGAKADAAVGCLPATANAASTPFAATAAGSLPPDILIQFMELLERLVAFREGDALPARDRRDQFLADVHTGRLAQTPNAGEPGWERIDARDPERERRYERNIRTIALSSMLFLKRSAGVGGPIPQDWLDSFHDIAQRQSEPVLQSFWSHLLAEKFAEPGTCTIKTLRTVEALTERQALLFTRFCRSIIKVGSDDDSDSDLLSIRIEKPNTRISYLEAFGFEMRFSDLVELEEFGLVTLAMGSYEVGPGAWLRYGDATLTVKETFRFKYNGLTAAGRELYPCVGELTRSGSYFKAIAEGFGQKVDVGWGTLRPS